MPDSLKQEVPLDGPSRPNGAVPAMPLSASPQRAFRRIAFGTPADRVRMGPLSLFALVVIIGLAVLSMLVFSTANASLVLSQRQADAVQATYANEQAAQEFVAALDEVLAPVRSAVGQGASADEAASAGAVQLVADELDELCAVTRVKVGGAVDVSAEMQNDRVLAMFASKDGQALNIAVTVSAEGVFHVESWKTSAAHDEEEQAGQLLKL